MEMDYETEEIKTTLNDIHKPSKLEKRVQTFIETILEVEPDTFEFSFQIDPKKLPWGKMTPKQLRKAYGILSAVTAVLESKPKPPKNLIAKKVQELFLQNN